MKNKIFKLAKGDFLTDDPEVILGASRIIFRVGEGDVYEGCLTLKDSHGGPLRGLVYTSLMRLKLKTQGFDSVSPEIAFSFDARGLKPGRSVTGQITVVTNGGEYSLPVTAIIEKPYVMSSIGKIQNLDTFACLAYKNFTEAHEIFKGREMRRIIRYEAPFVQALYEKMRTWSLSELALEEFLVATKKKERLNITLSDDNKVYDSVPETGTDEVILFKNDWGSLSVSVSAEGDFIVPEKTSYGREDFCGNTLRIGYRIDETKLHAGKNFGRIRVRTFYEEKTLSLCVKNGGKRGGHPVEKTMAELSLGRIRVEAGEITEIEFYEKAERQLKELKARVPEKRMTELYLAELYLYEGKRFDAAEIVDHLIWRREELKREPLLGLYQSYLRYKLDGEDRQREKLIGILKKHLKKDPQNETVSLCLLEVDPAYDDTEKRAAFLKALGDGGAHSVKFLFEAWRMYEENPELLKVLGPFEKRVLRFAVHYHLGGPFFLAQAVYLGSRKTTYDPGLTRTLKALFDLAEPGLKGEILPVITSQFIKGNVISPWAHAFYSASIENGHMITRLYEFFMMTLPDNAIDEKLPREVYIYFSYGDALPESKKALLYASVLRFLPMGDPMRENYKDRIRHFAEEQLRQRRISEALRVIYRNVLPEVELNMTELKALRDICHVYEVSTNMPGMKYILVLDKDGEITEKVPVKAGGRSQVVLRDPESRIVWEGMNGWHYADSFAYDMVRMFYETAFIDRVRVVEREEKEDEKVLSLTRQDILKGGFEAFSTRALFVFFEDEKIFADNREDTFLLSLAAYLYQSGVRSDKLVAYLGKWYTGPTEDMVRIWKDAKERGFDSRTLAEKIITQMLFSGQLVAEEAIFEDYYNGETLVAIKRAYLVKKGAEYLTRDAVTTEGYFDILKKEIEGRQPLPMVCRLAYLKHASSGQMAEEGLRDIFKDAILEGIQMPFFMDCPAEWLREMGISDKVILLYQGETGEEVSVYTAVTGEDDEPETFEREVLSPMWMNQYVGAFTVYAGEKLTWYFEEGDHKTQIRSLIKRQGSGCGRYSALSRILAADREERDHLVMDYYTEERLAEHFFGDEMVEEVWNR